MKCIEVTNLVKITNVVASIYPQKAKSNRLWSIFQEEVNCTESYRHTVIDRLICQPFRVQQDNGINRRTVERASINEKHNISNVTTPLLGRKQIACGCTMVNFSHFISEVHTMNHNDIKTP